MDMQLVTDPKILKLFPSLPPTFDEIDRGLAEYAAKQTKTEKFVFDEDGNVKPQDRCTWGLRRLSRFISRYVHFYKSPPSENRTFFLEQLESVAKENNVMLPQPCEMQSRKPVKRIVCESVERCRDNRLRRYKAYYDGENVVAYLPGENGGNEREMHERTSWDDLFDILYARIRKERSEAYMTKDQKANNRRSIEAEIVRQFYELYGYEDKLSKETCPEFVHRKVSNMSAAYSARQRRFTRKKDQVRWTAWWTITYDDKLYECEEIFRKRLLNKFRNLCTRNGWRIMGVFEHGEENGRLHFHGFFYIPKGQEIGELVQQKHFSEKEHRWYEYMENTEFRKLFGVNDYENIEYAGYEAKSAYAVYTMKMQRYMEKGEKVYYSRHIPFEFLIDLQDNDRLVAFSITCKRRIKRYVINDKILTRTDTNISRLPIPDRCDAYECGLQGSL